MNIDVDALSMNEIIQLQNRLSDSLRRRFTRPLALCFTDIVGSTAYFARFGDEAGTRLQQRHFELLRQAIEPSGGRIVDKAGDGAFSCFPAMLPAANALGMFFLRLAADNELRPAAEKLSVRSGMHWGEVLTDGEMVSGEAVNLCSRVASKAQTDEIVITKEAFQELPGASRARCKPKGLVDLAGIAGKVELFRLEWQDESRFAVSVLVRETGQEVLLPPHDTISFGRLPKDESRAGNDVLLTSPEPESARSISRFHFELRRTSQGFVLHALSRSRTVVDGIAVPEGGTAPVLPGSVVNVGGVLTLDFLGSSPLAEATVSTLLKVP